MKETKRKRRTALAALAVAVLAASATVSATGAPVPNAGLAKALTIAMRHHQPDGDGTRLSRRQAEVLSALEAARRSGAVLVGLRLHRVWAA